MPAPKRANTVAATWAARDAARRRALEDAAAMLRSAGGEAVLPFAMSQDAQHAWQLETRSAGETSHSAWKYDSHAGKSIWYTFDGAAIRAAELEERPGVDVRMTN
jgi:hypothetical protein